MRFYLKPEFDNRKSFYNKAVVEVSKNSKKLFSYNTLVAEIKEGNAFVYNMQSKTTIRHIKEFLLQNQIAFDDTNDIKKRYLKEG